MFSIVSSAFRNNSLEDALVEDGDPVRERENLRQLGRNQQHAFASTSFRQDRLVHVVDSAEIKAPSGLIEDDKPRALVHLARNDHFLLVAAGQTLSRPRRAPAS